MLVMSFLSGVKTSSLKTAGWLTLVVEEFVQEAQARIYLGDNMRGYRVTICFKHGRSNAYGGR